VIGAETSQKFARNGHRPVVSPAPVVARSGDPVRRKPPNRHCNIRELLNLDACEVDHLAPLLGFGVNELNKV